MKIIISLVAVLLFGSLLRLGFFSADNQDSFLTPGEQLLLENRLQQHHTRIISSSNPEELRLLHSPSRVVNVKSPHIDTLVRQMRLATITNNGLGLAAVQIGIPVRVVLMKLTAQGKTEFKAYFNPEILHKSPATKIYREACLSLPKQEVHSIERALRLKISYQTASGETIVEEMVGMDAVVFQQEMDHINGILIADYAQLE